MVGTRCTSIWTIRWLMTTTMLLNVGMLLAEWPENVIPAPDRTGSVEAAMFFAQRIFRAFSNTYGVQGNPQFRQGRQCDAPFALGGPAQQSQRDRMCYYCRQPEHVVRKCPFTKASQSQCLQQQPTQSSEVECDEFQFDTSDLCELSKVTSR